jgi:subtilisin family serine protease
VKKPKSAYLCIGCYARRCLLIALFLGLCFASTAGAAGGFFPTDPARSGIQSEWPSKKPIHPNLSSELSRLVEQWHESPGEMASSARRHGLTFRNGFVDVQIVMRDLPSVEGALRAIVRLGGKTTVRYEKWIEASMPVGALEALAGVPGVSLVERPAPVFPADTIRGALGSPLPAGTVLTQGVAASNADDWHSAGFTGKGVKVAVMDTFQDYTIAQANGELPPSISTYGTLDFSSRHGTAVGEIIYDMAPGASLTFASPNTATEMAADIVALAQSGHQVISSSIAFFNAEPGDGSGPVSNAINTARNTYHTLYVQAAGNQAQYHWDGAYSDASDGDGIHEFEAGSASGYIDDEEVNELGYLSSGMLYITLRWNAWPTTDQDYDLYLVYWTGSMWDIADSSEDSQTGTQPPTESIYTIVPAPGYYGIVISKFNANGTHILDLMGYNIPAFENNVSERSLVDPATAASAFSVAAVDVNTFNLEYYSSWGPTHGPGGTLIGGMNQPRIAGFANVNTWSFGAGVFNGTSAATPHVAGAAALVLDAFPKFTADNVASFLEGRAIDQGASGYDTKYGAGRLYLGDPPDLMFFPIISHQ